jgi:hypothetical protein
VKISRPAPAEWRGRRFAVAEVNRQEPEATFESQSRQRRLGVASDLWGFVRYHKKWWLLPILLALFALGALVWLGGSAAGPFVYTFF